MTGPLTTRASDDEVRKGFGRRLKAAREARELTQQQVAEWFDVNKATVSAWEQGVGVPDALRLRRLAKLYGTSSDALLWEEAESTQAMRFAAQFDALDDAQRRAFAAMWSAYYAQTQAERQIRAERGEMMEAKHAMAEMTWNDAELDALLQQMQERFGVSFLGHHDSLHAMMRWIATLVRNGCNAETVAANARLIAAAPALLDALRRMLLAYSNAGHVLARQDARIAAKAAIAKATKEAP
jgi:transcriptional regulator with XRE-family HTH domain